MAHAYGAAYACAESPSAQSISAPHTDKHPRPYDACRNCRTISTSNSAADCSRRSTASTEAGSPDLTPTPFEGPLGPGGVAFSPGAGSVDRASFKRVGHPLFANTAMATSRVAVRVSYTVDRRFATLCHQRPIEIEEAAYIRSRPKATSMTTPRRAGLRLRSRYL